MLSPYDDIESVKGVGKDAAGKLKRLGIRSVGGLIDFWPKRFEDYSHVSMVSNITQPGPVSLQVTFARVTSRYARRGLHLTTADAVDTSGAVKVVWFNQPYRSEQIKTSEPFFLSGELTFQRQQFSIINPSVERVSDLPTNTARILPKYRETKGLTSNQLRKFMREVLPLIQKLPESLPAWLVEGHKLISYAQSRRFIHFPESIDDLSLAKRRLAFEEAFGLTLSSQLARAELAQEKAEVIPFDQAATKRFVASLPFQLTGDQRRVAWQSLQDMAKQHPANRLIEGDVGAGKTVVAAIAALNAIQAGFQVALLAPTEILARQHHQTLQSVLGKHLKAKQIHLLVGSLSAKLKAEAKAAGADLLIGTHALLEGDVELPRLGLVIMDEQHRFGVRQRQALLAKAGHAPHVISLTATPIPRSLALTLYGELDISVIAEKPADRLPIKTTIGSPDSRAQIYTAVTKELDAGHQAFVVCPIIDESDTTTHISVTELHELLQKQLLKGYKIGLLHGRLKAADKEQIMKDFLSKHYDVLVCTTVIEVGVDVPNATVMVIEGADAFGLAQLHQLRGRVGRSDLQSYCYVIPSTANAPSRRLRAFASSNDGFKLAELDLELRGPGQIYGTLQHGALDLRMIRLTDAKLIAEARDAAKEFMERGENLLDYDQLSEQIKRLRTITHLN